MSKTDGMLNGIERLGLLSGTNSLQPGWLDVVENALAESGYYIAPIGQAGGHPTARSTDPRTSDGTKTYSLKAGTQRARLLETFGRWPDDGLTDEQAMEKTQGVNPNSEYATRCSELRHAGWIEDTGRDRKGNSGTPRIVSRITEKGQAQLRRIAQ